MDSSIRFKKESQKKISEAINNSRGQIVIVPPNGFETPRHVLIYCEREEARREELRRAGSGRLDLRKLPDTLEGAEVASR